MKTTLVVIVLVKLIKHTVALCRYDNCSQNLIIDIVVKSSELLTKSNSCTSLHATLNENV